MFRWCTLLITFDRPNFKGRNMSKVDVLKRIKNAEEKATTDVERARSNAVNTVARARQEAQALLDSAHDDARRETDELLSAQASEVKKESDKIVKKGQSNATELAEKAKGRIGDAVELLMEDFEGYLNA